jgi:hypothetical protein
MGKQIRLLPHYWLPPLFSSRDLTRQPGCVNTINFSPQLSASGMLQLTSLLCPPGQLSNHSGIYKADARFFPDSDETGMLGQSKRYVCASGLFGTPQGAHGGRTAGCDHNILLAVHHVG